MATYMDAVNGKHTDGREQEYTYYREVREEVIDEIAKFIETQRNDIPATGEEFAAAIRSLK